MLELSELPLHTEPLSSPIKELSSTEFSGGVVASFPDADLCLFLDFERGTENPTRVFKSLMAMIDALQGIEATLVKNLQPELETLFLLEDLETCCIKVWLRRKINGTLSTIDRESLKSGDWKKVLGSYLDKGVGKLLAATADTPDPTRADLETLASSINQDAVGTGLRWSDLGEPLTVNQVAGSLQTLSTAAAPLSEYDKLSILTALGEHPLNIGFRLDAERLEEILTFRVIENTSEEILKIRKPDLLGDAQWEFKLGDAPWMAKVVDPVFVQKFKRRHVKLSSGDAIRAKVRTITKFGHEGDIVSQTREVIEILEEYHLDPEPLPSALAFDGNPG